jgi:hypothetical protein
MNSENIFEIGEYASEQEAAFAYNVAAMVFKGPDAELNEGLNLSLQRKKEIEQEVLYKIKLYLELPKEFKFGRFPQLYAAKAS